MINAAASTTSAILNLTAYAVQPLLSSSPLSDDHLSSLCNALIGGGILYGALQLMWHRQDIAQQIPSIGMDNLPSDVFPAIMNNIGDGQSILSLGCTSKAWQAQYQIVAAKHQQKYATLIAYMDTISPYHLSLSQRAAVSYAMETGNLDPIPHQPLDPRTITPAAPFPKPGTQEWGNLRDQPIGSLPIGNENPTIVLKQQIYVHTWELLQQPAIRKKCPQMIQLVQILLDLSAHFDRSNGWEKNVNLLIPHGFISRPLAIQLANVDYLRFRYLQSLYFSNRKPMDNQVPKWQMRRLDLNFLLRIGFKSFKSFIGNRLLG